MEKLMEEISDKIDNAIAKGYNPELLVIGENYGDAISVYLNGNNLSSLIDKNVENSRVFKTNFKGHRFLIYIHETDKNHLSVHGEKNS